MNTNWIFNKLIILKKGCFRVLAVGLFLILFYRSAGQDAFIDLLRSGFKHFDSISLQEKVYVHTNKEFYLSGETIWFRIYNVDATQNKSVTTNKVCYVEVFDKENKVVLHGKISMENGLGNGSFLLPSSFPSGNYLIRAYTAWVKNFPPQFYFQKEIKIVNTLKRPDWKAFDKNESYYVQFFPEGGNLVTGIKSRVGFKITDQYGKGISANGIVIDDSKDTLVRFKTLYFGLGSFYFIPSANKNYQAIIQLNNGKQITQVLPTSFASGYVMTVLKKDTSHLSVQVKATSPGSSLLYLIVHSRNTIQLALAEEMINGEAEFIVDKNILPDGISQFTVFNELKSPVCERLYFKSPNGTTADIQSKEDFDLRSKVDLNIKLPFAPDSKTDFSLSVYLYDSLQSTPHTNIVNYLLLTSELGGTIESPDFYFNDKAPMMDEAIDNLMLTHGWRRFKWEDILSSGKPSFSFLPDYEGQLISGKITNKRTGYAIANRLVWLSIPGKKFHLSNSLSNDKGELNFVVKNVYGPSELILQTDTADAEDRIDIMNPYSEQLPSHNFSHFNLTEDDRDLLITHSINSQLESEFASKQIQSFNPGFSEDSIQFYLQPDAKYVLDDYTRFPTMEEVMREFVFKVRVRQDHGIYRFNVLNTPYKSYFEKDPLILLDGVPVFNTNKIIAFDPLKIKSIDVIARKYFYENKITNGIVSYSTYDGDLGSFELDPNAVIMEYEGLQMQREFYSPLYNSPSKLKNHTPDKRNALYWYSGMHISEKNVHLSFYTSDVPGNYIIEAEGLNSDGKPFSATKIITVSK